MNSSHSKIYTADQAELSTLNNKTVAVIGYGNQGRAQALNLRDNGIHVIIGNRKDRYYGFAASDGFEVREISTAVSDADICFLLLPDETLPQIYQENVQPNLDTNKTLVFASGYSIAFGLIIPPIDNDILLIAPRMIGVGVRERYLTGEGFYCFVGVHQNVSGSAESIMLALTAGVGGLIKPAIQVSFKQEAELDLFNEQAFGPAFGRVLLTAISVLIDKGLPPEAVLVEMYMSEEMSYTYKKMAETGLVKQTLYHSQTSQYGAMSRGIRFMGIGLRKRMERIFEEIDSGSFVKEWNNPLAKIKFSAIRFFAMRQWINTLEMSVRKALNMSSRDIYMEPMDIENIRSDPRLNEELNKFEQYYSE